MTKIERFERRLSFFRFSDILNLFRILPFLASTAFAGEPHLIVDVPTGYLIGATSGEKWIAAETAQRLVKGGEKYRIYSLNENLGRATGAKPESAGAPCEEVQIIPLKPKHEKGVLAMTGDWNALPRVPKSQADTQPAYLKIVSDFLDSTADFPVNT